MKLVVCDMDGTLLDDQKRIDEDFLKIVEKHHRNINFVIASGRPYYTLKKVFKDYLDYLYFICDNGSFVMHKDKCLINMVLKKEIVLSSLNELKKDQKLFPILCAYDTAYVDNHDTDFLNNAREYYKKIILVDDLKDVENLDKIGKIAIYDPIDSKSHAYEKMKFLKDEAKVSVSAFEWLDINPNGVNKGEALKKLVKKLKITKKDCVGFGDYLNDFEMLKFCHYSYAMENAVDEIKEISRFITCSNNEKGVSKALKKLLK